MAVLGLCRETVVTAWELPDGDRPNVEVWLRMKARRPGRCGRCGEFASFYDQGGDERRWRHIDVGFATCELIADAPRVDCAGCGPTVAAVPWARHDSSFTRAFEDLVVHDAIVGNKQAAADRYQVSWRAVNNMCVRVATEALGRVDLLDGLVAVAAHPVGQHDLAWCGHHDLAIDARCLAACVHLGHPPHNSTARWRATEASASANCGPA